MHRSPRSLIAVGLLMGGLLTATAACSDTGDPGTTAVTVAGEQLQRTADPADVTTTTAAPTTLPPTTTTTAPRPPPPTTAAPKAPASAPVVHPAAAAPPAPAPKPAPVAISPCQEGGMLAMINGARQGLPALTLRSGATSVACTWSAHMAKTGLAHNPDRAGDLAAHGVSDWSTSGENVGYASSPGQVFSLFMGSGPHRANILNPAYREVGIGVVRAGSRYWVTVDFGG